MNRYKCRDCGGLSYSASPHKEHDARPYCGGRNNTFEGIGGPKPRENTLRLAIETWGRNAQVDMMIEEMSELTKALLKERRCPPLPVKDLEGAIANIREEMADVQIMLDQMKLIYGDPIGIEREKLRRLVERLDDHAERLETFVPPASPATDPASLRWCRRPEVNTEGGDAE